METPVTVTEASVETPVTTNELVETLSVEPLPDAAVTVTTPADTGDTERLVPKLIVPATPITDPLSLTLTPLPDTVTPVSDEPSPTKLEAVMIPVVLILIVEDTPDTITPVIPEPSP